MPHHFTEFLQPHSQNRIQIGKYNQPRRLRLLPNFRRQLEHLCQRGAVFERPFAGSLDHRPIRHRIAERHAQLDHIRPGLNCRQHDLARRRQIRIAARQRLSYGMPM